MAKVQTGDQRSWCSTCDQEWIGDFSLHVCKKTTLLKYQQEMLEKWALAFRREDRRVAGLGMSSDPFVNQLIRNNRAQLQSDIENRLALEGVDNAFVFKSR